uniref:Uncharacterized protein n=1 Tax=Candidatus Kentrum sp. DK TaxID=2126562 RepID=A0A450SSN4_9GAMM|nr:MAG: hypothetical protein BECKDK2373C_GA0170839_105611 [Candidatus Kentron sp. DK]
MPIISGSHAGAWERDQRQFLFFSAPPLRTLRRGGAEKNRERIFSSHPGSRLGAHDSEAGAWEPENVASHLPNGQLILSNGQLVGWAKAPLGTFKRWRETIRRRAHHLRFPRRRVGTRPKTISFLLCAPSAHSAPLRFKKKDYNRRGASVRRGGAEKNRERIFSSHPGSRFSCSQAPAWEHTPRKLPLPNPARPGRSPGAKERISFSSAASSPRPAATATGPPTGPRRGARGKSVIRRPRLVNGGKGREERCAGTGNRPGFLCSGWSFLSNR